MGLISLPIAPEIIIRLKHVANLHCIPAGLLGTILHYTNYNHSSYYIMGNCILQIAYDGEPKKMYEVFVKALDQQIGLDTTLLTEYKPYGE